MTGLKLGDRLLFLGSSDTMLAAALASKVGLTGRACLVDEPADRLTAAAALVEQEGALVESFAAPLTALPFEASSFDRRSPHRSCNVPLGVGSWELGVARPAAGRRVRMI